MTQSAMRPVEDIEVGRRSVLGRVFDILDCFGGPDPALSVTAIGDRTGLPAATVHRLLATLVEWGAVERASRGQYRLGKRLWRLGWGVPRAREVHDIARPHMVDLYAATHELVVMASRDGDDLLLIDDVAGSAVGQELRVRRRRPLGSCAAGLIYLAHLDLAELRGRLAESTLGLPAPLARDEFRLLQVLGEIRRAGIACTPDRGHVWLSAPVFNAAGGLLSTLSLVVPEDRAQPAQQLPLLARTAREMSAGLGCRRHA